MLSKFSLSMLLWTAVSARPNPSLPPAQVCKQVNVVVDVLQLYPRAASFCSSFIKIPILTSTTTNTGSTTTVYPTTTTNTVNQTTTVTSTRSFPDTSVTTVATVTATAFVTGTTTITIGQEVDSTTTATITVSASPVTASTTQTVTSTSTFYPNFNNQRRAETDPHVKRALPPQLASFATSVLSTGCSCLNLPTSTTTVTVGGILTVSATSTAVTTKSATIQVTVTTIGTQPVPATAQTTVTSTVTVSAGHTSTSTSVVVSSTTVTVTPTNTVTVTSTSLATVTATADPCNPTNAIHYTNGDGEPFHDFQGHNNPSGELTSAGATDSPEGCCRACYAAMNCDYVLFDASQFGNTCFYVGLGTGYTGASAQCPNGISFDPATGGSPGLGDSNGQTFVVGPCYAGPR